MIPYFSFNHFQLGPITIYTWGFFVGLGFLIGYLWVLWQARKKGMELEKIAFLTLAIFLGAVLGSRFLFLLQTPEKFFNDLSLLWKVQNGGMMIWGGILGGIFFGWLFLKWQKMDFWPMADIFAPAAALGIAIGRIGCFLLNDHQGAATNLPWGILWPDGVLRHPVALYEILAMAGLFFLLWRLISLRGVERRSNPACASPEASARRGNSGNNSGLPRPAVAGLTMTEGLLFLLFLIGYALIRFFLDFFRVSLGSLADPQWLGLFTSQWVSILVILFSISICIGVKPKIC